MPKSACRSLLRSSRRRRGRLISRLRAAGWSSVNAADGYMAAACLVPHGASPAVLPARGQRQEPEGTSRLLANRASLQLSFLAWRFGSVAVEPMRAGANDFLCFQWRPRRLLEALPECRPPQGGRLMAPFSEKLLRICPSSIDRRALNSGHRSRLPQAARIAFDLIMATLEQVGNDCRAIHGQSLRSRGQLLTRDASRCQRTSSTANCSAMKRLLPGRIRIQDSKLVLADGGTRCGRDRLASAEPRNCSIACSRPGSPASASTEAIRGCR